VGLAGASAGLGLLRELYVVRTLGLSSTNDTLQYYLSIVYTISLLSDPIRLAALNLLQERNRAATYLIVAIVMVPVSLVITAAYALSGGVHDTLLLVAACFGGGLNLLVAVGCSDGQRSRSFVGTQAVMALPNIVLIIGVFAVPALTTISLADTIIYVYAVVPALQIIAFLLMPLRAGAPTTPDHAPMAIGAGLKNLLSHSTSAGGSQLGQFALRTTLSGATVGSLTLVSFLIRIYDTLRVIFVDSFVGSRVAGWTSGESHVPRLLDARHHVVPLLAISTLALVAGWIPVTSAQATAGVALGILLVALYAASSLRVMYSFVNTITTPGRLIVAVGLADVAVGLAAAGMAFVPWLPRLALLWILYVGRSLVLLWFVARHPSLERR
jgi:hypothetical protein